MTPAPRGTPRRRGAQGVARRKDGSRELEGRAGSGRPCGIRAVATGRYGAGQTGRSRALLRRASPRPAREDTVFSANCPGHLRPRRRRPPGVWPHPLPPRLLPALATSGLGRGRLPPKPPRGRGRGRGGSRRADRPAGSGGGRGTEHPSREPVAAAALSGGARGGLPGQSRPRASLLPRRVAVTAAGSVGSAQLRASSQPLPFKEPGGLGDAAGSGARASCTAQEGRGARGERSRRVSG